MNLINALNWRYATKHMNGERVPQDTVNRIIEAARLAPSSYGLQPYSVLVVTDPALRQSIQQQAAQQPQISECSHLLVFAVWDRIGDHEVDDFIALTARERGTPASELKDYADVIKGTLNGFGSEAEKHHWAARQAYIGLGMALAAAALEKVDATPMEGFDPQALDRVLGLPERGLRSVVVTTLGYRDADNDWLAAMPKVRWPLETFRQLIA